MILAAVLLAILPMVLGGAETICFNDDNGHFGQDPITPFAGPDLQTIITSIQNNQLLLAGGSQVNNSLFQMENGDSIIVQYQTALVCLQNPDVFGNALDFADTVTALDNFVSQCCSDLSGTCQGGGTAVGNLGGGISPGQVNLWIQNLNDSISHNCILAGDMTNLASWNVAGAITPGIGQTAASVMTSSFSKDQVFAAVFGGIGSLGALAAAFRGFKRVNPLPIAEELQVFVSTEVVAEVSEDTVLDISKEAQALRDIVALLQASGDLPTAEADIAATVADAVADGVAGAAIGIADGDDIF